jgi:hypothetical protein
MWEFLLCARRPPGDSLLELGETKPAPAGLSPIAGNSLTAELHAAFFRPTARRARVPGVPEILAGARDNPISHVGAASC